MNEASSLPGAHALATDSATAATEVALLEPSLLIAGRWWVLVVHPPQFHLHISTTAHIRMSSVWDTSVFTKMLVDEYMLRLVFQKRLRVAQITYNRSACLLDINKSSVADSEL